MRCLARCAVAMINGLIAEIDAPVAEIIARILRQTATGKEVGKVTANAITKCGVVNEVGKGRWQEGWGLCRRGRVQARPAKGRK